MSKSIRVGMMMALFLVAAASQGVAATDPTTTQANANSADAKQLILEGKLRCTYSRSGNFPIFTYLVKTNDGEELKVSDPSEDLKSKCPPDGQLSATSFKVQGQLTSQFLFWGGNLKVNSFKVTEN